MNISWAALEQMAKGRRPIPCGCTLEYEFRPSLIWYPDIYRVHDFWKYYNPNESKSFWHLEPEERKEWEYKYLQAKYKVFKVRRYWDCAWQRFTLTSHNPCGKTLILQMDSQGRVTQLKEVEITQKVLVTA